MLMLFFCVYVAVYVDTDSVVVCVVVVVGVTVAGDGVCDVANVVIGGTILVAVYYDVYDVVVAVDDVDCIAIICSVAS